MTYFYALIKSTALLAMACMVVMTPSTLAAEEQSVACFPANIAWGLNVDQVVNLMGQPKEESVLIIPGEIASLTYQGSQFNRRYDSMYLIQNDKLDAIYYTFAASPEVEPAELFAHLESAVNCLFNLPAFRLDINKNSNKVSFAFWEDDITLACLSSFSGSPHIVSLEFVDKKSENSQSLVDVAKKARAYKIKEDLKEE